MKWTPKFSLPVTFASITILLAATISTSAVAKEIYIWSDENGVPNFADLPPPGYQTEIMELPGSTAGEAPADPAEEENPVTQTQNNLCPQHQDRLERMLKTRNVSVIDENGESRQLDDAEYENMILESRTYLADRCD